MYHLDKLDFSSLQPFGPQPHAQAMGQEEDFALSSQRQVKETILYAFLSPFRFRFEQKFVVNLKIILRVKTGPFCRKVQLEGVPCKLTASGLILVPFMMLQGCLLTQIQSLWLGLTKDGLNTAAQIYKSQIHLITLSVM